MTSFVSVTDASRSQTQTDVTATTWVVGAMSAPAGMKVNPGFQPTAAAVPDAGRSTTVAVEPTTTTTTTITDLLPSTRPSTASTSAPPIQTASTRADVTSSTSAAAAAGHTVTATTAGSATSSSVSGVAVPAGEPPLPSSSSTPAAVVVSTTAAATTSPAAATTSPAALVVVVRQFQPVRPYNGSTSWKLFREHYRRVAKMNSWTSNEELLSHLTLALEGPSAEVLRDFDETSPTALTNLWARLEHRFGEIDKAREAMRRFVARRQSDTKSVVEFEQALRVLYREAWYCSCRSAGLCAQLTF